MAAAAVHPLVGELRLELPAHGALSPTEPVAFDTGAAPGAKELLAIGWGSGAQRVDARCMGLPDAYWIDGFERPLLDAASAMTRRAVELPTVTPGPIEGRGPFTQHLRGDGLSARHWLGFGGESVTICTVACRGEGCETWLEGVRFEGSAPPPAPSWWVAQATSAAASPRVTVLSAVALGLVVVALVLRQRPRPSR